MKPAVRSLKAFNGDQLFAVNGWQEADTGIDRTVDDAVAVSCQLTQNDRARPAVAFGTSLLRASATRYVAQVLEHGRRGRQP